MNEPDLEAVKGVGFCVSIRHAEYMAEMFNQRGILSASMVSGLNEDTCAGRLNDLKEGEADLPVYS